MDITLFDLDHTLIIKDSDYEWNNFLINKKIIKSNLYKKENKKFYEKYKLKILNPTKYIKFILYFLSKISYKKIFYIRNYFLINNIKIIINKKTLFLIKKHINNKNLLFIITSTNIFITKYIKYFLKINNLISVKLKLNINYNFYRKKINFPTYGINKIFFIKKYFKKEILNFKKIYFYSDSENDLPLLSTIKIPIITNPKKKFKKKIINKKWSIIYLNN